MIRAFWRTATPRFRRLKPSGNFANIVVTLRISSRELPKSGFSVIEFITGTHFARPCSGHPEAFRKGSVMKLPRRRFLHLAAGAAALPAALRVAKAQSYPVRPVRLIVGFPAGGA